MLLNVHQWMNEQQIVSHKHIHILYYDSTLKWNKTWNLISRHIWTWKILYAMMCHVQESTFARLHLYEESLLPGCSILMIFKSLLQDIVMEKDFQRCIFFLANRKNVLYTTSQKITKRQNSIVLTIHVDKNYIR